MKIHSIYTPVAAAILLSLSACGGGGGSDPATSTELDALGELDTEINTDTADNNTNADDVENVDGNEQAQSILDFFDTFEDSDRGMIIPGQPGTGNRVAVPDAPGDQLWGVVEFFDGSDFEALFGMFGRDASAARYLSRLNRDLDSCLVLDAEDDDEENYNGRISHLEFSNRDAGEVLILSNAAGTIEEVDRHEVLGYFSDSFIRTDTPLMVDITGGDFPAIPTITFPDIEDFRGVSTSTFSLSTGNRFFTPAANDPLIWEAGSDPDATIELGFEAALPIGSFNQVFLYCTLEDDGEFQIPSVVTDMFTSSEDRGTIELTRQKIETVTANGATVIVVRTTGR